MKRTLFNPDRRIAVYADCEVALPVIDVHRESKKSGRIHEIVGLTGPIGRKAQPFLESAKSKVTAELEVSPQMNVPLDFETWLPFCAPHYNISPDPKDYLIVPVIIMPSDLPNRNSVGFPLRELVRFNPDLGMQAYKTWKGQPTHREHQNSDITKAYGVIVDSFMRPMLSHGQNKIWKLLHLLSFDRTKHPELTSKIESGEENSYSMGAYVDSYTCSVCGADLGRCLHLKEKAVGEFYKMADGTLAFKNVRGIKGFETSSVADPAYVSAISETVKSL